MVRWTTPQHPCCNPARLVLPAAYVDHHVERGPRAASSIRNAREDLPPAGQWTGSPACPRQSLPVRHPCCCADRRGCGHSSAKPWSLAILPHRHVSDFQRRLELRQHLTFF